MFIKKLHQQVICNHHEPIAHTPLGDLRGVKTEDAYIFREIQYAHARRFHLPEPAEAWEGVKDLGALGIPRTVYGTGGAGPAGR